MMSKHPDLIIRKPTPQDMGQWAELWRGYLAYYETSRHQEIYDSTWQRFFDDGFYMPNCLVAELDGQLVGLVHYMFHSHCWSIEPVCYLQDLYAAPDQRGTGIGRALIEAVYAAADEQGCPTVYWLTQDFNETGRRLYDRVGQLTPFIKYQRPR